jgi:transmembrane protein
MLLMSPMPAPLDDRTASGHAEPEPAYLIARILLAGGFVFSGINKLLDFTGATAEMAHHGLPFPALMAVAVVITQLGGSALLIWPRTSWIGAWLLAGFTVVATLIAHAPWNDAGPIALPQSVIFLQNAGVLGGLLLALVFGAKDPVARLIERFRA